MEKTVNTFKDIESIVLEKNGFTKTTVNSIYDAICALYPNHNTQSKYLSSIKKTMLAIEKKKSIRVYISEKMNCEHTTEIKQNYDAKIKAKMENLGAAYQLSSETAKKFIDISKKNLNSTNFFEVLGAIICLSGRRPSEVLRGEWNFEKREFYTYGIIAGASKKRNLDAQIAFPLLYDTDLIRAVKFVQNHEILKKEINAAKEIFAKIEADAYVFERKIREHIEKQTAHRLNIEFAKIYKVDETGLNAKQLRQMYGHYFAFTNGKGRNVEFEGKILGVLNFFSKILAHGNETKTAQSYYSEMEIM